MNVMTRQQHIVDLLEELSMMPESDLENNEVEVLYESESGVESFAGMGITDLAGESAKLIKSLQEQLRAKG